MPAFIDARCAKCGERVGWFGELPDMPACSRCGYKPDKEAFASDQKELDEFRERLRKKVRKDGSEVGIKEKIDYVKAQGQTRDHRCHWPGCTQQVPPAMWGCKEHWFKLPHRLRQEIWKTFRPGQEKDMRPSKEYLAAAERVQQWIKEHLEDNS